MEPTPPDGVESTLHPFGPIRSEDDPTAPTRPHLVPTTPDEVPDITIPKPKPTEPETEPTEPTVPEPTAPHGIGISDPLGDHEAGTGLVIPWQYIVAGAALLGLLVRRPVTLTLRKKQRKRRTMRAFLARWRYDCRFARRVRAPLRHEDLALKVRFSQHPVSDEDLAQLAAWEQELHYYVLSKPIWHRFILRWIFVFE